MRPSVDPDWLAALAQHDLLRSEAKRLGTTREEAHVLVEHEREAPTY
jgi:hypothetical protein